MKKTNTNGFMIIAISVLVVIIGIIGFQAFTSINEKQQSRNELFLRGYEAENWPEKLKLVPRLNLGDSELLIDEGILPIGSSEEPSDPIVSLLRHLESLDSYTRHFYYVIGGMAFIAVILVLWCLVSLRGFIKMENLRREVHRLETKNDKHKRYADILEQIQDDIREINTNGNAARVYAQRSDDTCRELSNPKFSAVISDLTRAEQAIEDVAATLNDTATSFQKRIRAFENAFEEIADKYAANLSKHDELLRDQLFKARSAEDLQAAYMYATTE